MHHGEHQKSAGKYRVFSGFVDDPRCGGIGKNTHFLSRKNRVYVYTNTRVIRNFGLSVYYILDTKIVEYKHMPYFNLSKLKVINILIFIGIILLVITASIFFDLNKNRKFSNPQYKHIHIQQILTLPHEGYAHSLVTVGNYIYMVTLTSPGKVIKVDMNNIQHYQIAQLPQDSGAGIVYIKSLDKLYAVSGGRNMCIDEIAPSTLSSRVILCIDTYKNDDLPAITSDGSYLYVITTTKPALVYKINPNTMKEEKRLALINELSYGHAINYHDGYIFATGENKNGWIVKIDDKKFQYTYKMFPSEVAYPTNEFTITGKYAYVGFENNSGILFQIDINTLAIKKIYTGIEERTYDTYYDGDKIYSLFTGHPGMILTFNPNDLEMNEYKLPYDAPNKIRRIGSSFLITSWSQPLTLIKIIFEAN